MRFSKPLAAAGILSVTLLGGTALTGTAFANTTHAPARFKAATPPTAQLHRHYSYTFGVTGSPTPKITLASGKLPSGLRLTTNGTLSGTPTHRSTYTFTLKATNGTGTPAEAHEHVTVR
jgi:hypothetical protein